MSVVRFLVLGVMATDKVHVRWPYEVHLFFLRSSELITSIF
jgi:hypothetical protein